MDGVIIYVTGSASVNNYAQRLSQECQLDCHPIKTNNHLPVLSQVSFIVLGTSISQGCPLIVPWMIEQWNALQGKKLLIYCVPPNVGNPKGQHELLSQSFPLKGRNEFELFVLQRLPKARPSARGWRLRFWRQQPESTLAREDEVPEHSLEPAARDEWASLRARIRKLQANPSSEITAREP